MAVPLLGNAFPGDLTVGSGLLALVEVSGAGEAIRNAKPWPLVVTGRVARSACPEALPAKFRV